MIPKKTSEGRMNNIMFRPYNVAKGAILYTDRRKYNWSIYHGMRTTAPSKRESAQYLVFCWL
jgi:hypothetical protein